MIELNNESGTEVDTERLVGLATFALDALRIHPQAELSILLVDTDTMSAYHEKFMGEPGPTDVLSFPMDELRAPSPHEESEPGVLGDVVLCPQVAAEQGEAAGHGLTDELELLLTQNAVSLLEFIPVRDR